MSETVSYNADTASNSPGAVLKRCREYHGITLEEAAEATKMGKNYLVALENDNEKEFASPAYLKGFLRIYTTYLGLNPDDMIRLYEKRFSQDKDVASVVEKSGSEGEPFRRRLSLKRFALPAFLLLLIIITASIINRSEAPVRREQAPPQAVEQKPAQAVQPVHSSVHSPSPPREPEKRPDPVEQPAATTAADQGPHALPETAKGFIVRMKVTQNGTLNVTIDGTLSQKYDLTAGDAIEWKAERQVALDLSNAGGVEVELNGKALKSFGPAGKPVFIVLDADGVRP